MSEANDLTNAIINEFYSYGAYAWRATTLGLFDQKLGTYRTAPKKGVSDILAVMPPHGTLIAVEVKIGKDRMSDEQIGFLKNIETVGGLSFVARNIGSFREWWYDVRHDNRSKKSSR